LAFGLWAFVVNTGFRQVVLPDTIPIKVNNLTTDLALATDLPAVQVEIWAPTASFSHLKPEDLTASINLQGLSAGEHTVTIKVFAEDPNVRVTKITPTQAKINLEKKSSKDFNLKVETQGQLGQGFVADRAKLTPSKITLRGAKSRLARVDQVVVRVALNGETEDIEKTLKPLALDVDRKQIDGLEFDPAEVKVKLPIIQAEDAKTVGVKVSTSGAPADGFFVGTITVKPSTVTAEGSSKSLKKITSLATKNISLDGASETIKRTIDLDLPDNVNAEPSSVQVTIEIKAGSASKDFSLPPKIINIKAGLGSTVTPPNLQVTLTGPANLIKPLDAASLTLKVDVAGLVAGDHTINLTKNMLGLDSQIEANFSVSSIVVHLKNI